MKLAIISDIHDNLANLEKFLEVAKELKVKGIICCGDVTTPETLEMLTSRFAGPIKLACGNMEIRREEFAAVAERHKNSEVFEEVGEWQIDDLKMAFLHRPNKVEKLAQTGRYRFIFYGHTHRPWISQLGETLTANPGTLGGVFTAPTFAVLDSDTGQLELKKLY